MEIKRTTKNKVNVILTDEEFKLVYSAICYSAVYAHGQKFTKLIQDVNAFKESEANALINAKEEYANFCKIFKGQSFENIFRKILVLNLKYNWDTALNLIDVDYKHLTITLYKAKSGDWHINPNVYVWNGDFTSKKNIELDV